METEKWEAKAIMCKVFVNLKLLHSLIGSLLHPYDRPKEKDKREAAAAVKAIMQKATLNS